MNIFYFSEKFNPIFNVARLFKLFISFAIQQGKQRLVMLLHIYTVKGRRIYEPAIICKLYVYYNDQIRYASFIPLAPSSWHSEVPTYVTSCFIMHFLYIHNNRYNGFAIICNIYFYSDLCSRYT